MQMKLLILEFLIGRVGLGVTEEISNIWLQVCEF